MNYSKVALKARNAIKKNGGVCSLHRLQSETYNPTTDEYETTYTEISGYALMNTYDIKDIDGTNIRLGDIALMCVFDSAPEINDKVEFGNKEYSIVSITPFNVDGATDIYYTIQAR